MERERVRLTVQTAMMSPGHRRQAYISHSLTHTHAHTHTHTHIHTYTRTHALRLFHLCVLVRRLADALVEEACGGRLGNSIYLSIYLSIHICHCLCCVLVRSLAEVLIKEARGGRLGERSLSALIVAAQNQGLV
jgi:hypothetical protein